MRICGLTSTFLPRIGGHETVVDQLTRHFNKSGHESVVLAQHLSVKGTPGRVDVPYRIVRFRKPFSQVWDLGAIRRALLRLHKAWPFDIIHSHSSYPTGYIAVQTAAKLRVPVVVTPHGSDIAETSRFRTRPVVMGRIRQTLEMSDAVTSISQYLRERALTLAPACANHLVAITNGIDCAAFAKPAAQPAWARGLFADSKPNYFLFLGRFHPRKGVDVLIDAFREMARSNEQVQLVIGGDGVDRAALHARAEQSGMAGRIHFAGVVSGQEKLWLLQNALALVVPTKTWEGLPIVVLEGIASGQAIVASEVGGIVDLVTDGENGLLVKPSDVGSLAEALRRISDNPSLRASMGAVSQLKAKAYDWPDVTARYVSLFEGLLKKSRRQTVPA